MVCDKCFFLGVVFSTALHYSSIVSQDHDQLLGCPGSAPWTAPQCPLFSPPTKQRFRSEQAKQTTILHVILVDGEDVLLWEYRTRWNNIPASYSNFISEIVLRLSHSVTKRSEEAENWAAVFRAGTTTLTIISQRRERLLVQQCPCIRFSVCPFKSCF